MNRRQYERAIRDMVWLPVFDRRLRPIGYEAPMQAGFGPLAPPPSMAGRPSWLRSFYFACGCMPWPVLMRTAGRSPSCTST